MLIKIRLILILLVLFVTVLCTKVIGAYISWNPTDFKKKSYVKTLIYTDSMNNIAPIKLYSAKNEYIHFRISLVAPKNHNGFFNFKGGNAEQGYFHGVHGSDPPTDGSGAGSLRPVRYA